MKLPSRSDLWICVGHAKVPFSQNCDPGLKENYAATRLSKKGASTNTLPPTPVEISATAPYEAIRPIHTACDTKSRSLIDPQAAELASQEPPKDVAAQSFSHHCEHIRRQLVASELVLLATTAIGMDTWASIEQSRLAPDSAHPAVFRTTSLVWNHLIAKHHNP